MGIQAFPTILQPIIQQNFLERQFRDALRSKHAYRSIATREQFPNGIGETITKTRAGLKSTAMTPLNPSGNTNFDNGLTPSPFGVEQYTLSINMYGDTIDLNMVADEVGISRQFLQNATVNGEQSGRTLEELARGALFNAYLGGNTRVRVTLGAPATTISVDDVRGFQSVFVNGVVTTTSNTNYVTCVIGSNSYNIGTVTVDGSNVSTTPGGKSGTLQTVSGNITVADGTALNAVVAGFAPKIIRPNARATDAALVAGDLLTMANLLDAKVQLELNAVPTVDGFYNVYLDPTSARQLFADSDFKVLFQGATAENSFYGKGSIEHPFLGLKFFKTTEAYVQSHPSIAGAYIRRPIVVGAGALVEGTFAGQTASAGVGGQAIRAVVDDIVMVTRPPMDRLGQIVAQSWYWCGGYALPTDVTTTASTVPTATSSAWKRAVVLSHIG